MGKTKQQRQRERAGTRLRDKQVSPGTLTKYKKAAASFFTYCRLQGYRSPSHPATIDARLCEYIEAAWQEGEARAVASSARSAMGFFLPAVSGHLHGSQRLLKAWGKHEPPRRATPLPTSFLLALVGAAVRAGDLRLALAVMVAFHGLLRTGEMLAMEASHFVMPSAPGPVVLSLPSTKSGNRAGTPQATVVLTDPTVRAYLAAVLPHLQPHQRIYPYTGHVFRTDFARLVRSARLPAANWQPYSLRRGGATAHFVQYGSLDRTAVRGRWKCVATARIYVDEGIAVQAQLAPTPAQQARINELAQLVQRPTTKKSNNGPSDF